MSAARSQRINNPGKSNRPILLPRREGIEYLLFPTSYIKMLLDDLGLVKATLCTSGGTVE